MAQFTQEELRLLLLCMDGVRLHQSCYLELKNKILELSKIQEPDSEKAAIREELAEAVEQLIKKYAKTLGSLKDR